MEGFRLYVFYLDSVCLSVSRAEAVKGHFLCKCISDDFLKEKFEALYTRPSEGVLPLRLELQIQTRVSSQKDKIK